MTATKTKNVYWITGASSGIGRALALELARPGNSILLSGRNLGALSEVKAGVIAGGAECEVLAFDALDIESFTEIIKQAIGVFGQIDVLVNNAGVSQRSPALETSPEVEKKLMQINYFSPVALSKALLPHFISQNGGHLVVVSSIAGKFGFSLRSSYAAAKHALHGYFEALRLELRNVPVHVTMVCPGRVKTNVSVNALQGNGKAHSQMDDGQRKGISAESCARQIAKAINNKKYEVLIGGAELIPVYLKRFCPPLFYYLIKKVKPT
jgi:dehydrogenase/reductase SDR family protein 7B